MATKIVPKIGIEHQGVCVPAKATATGKGETEWPPSDLQTWSENPGVRMVVLEGKKGQRLQRSHARIQRRERGSGTLSIFQGMGVRMVKSCRTHP